MCSTSIDLGSVEMDRDGPTGRNLLNGSFDGLSTFIGVRRPSNDITHLITVTSAILGSTGVLVEEKLP